MFVQWQKEVQELLRMHVRGHRERIIATGKDGTRMEGPHLDCHLEVSKQDCHLDLGGATGCEGVPLKTYFKLKLKLKLKLMFISFNQII